MSRKTGSDITRRGGHYIYGRLEECGKVCEEGEHLITDGGDDEIIGSACKNQGNILKILTLLHTWCGFTFFFTKVPYYQYQIRSYALHS